MNCFDDLIAANNTIILIEHNLTVMTQADWIVDIGPYAGEQGGYLLFEGRPQALLDQTSSFTAKHLKNYITQNK